MRRCRDIVGDFRSARVFGLSFRGHFSLSLSQNESPLFLNERERPFGRKHAQKNKKPRNARENLLFLRRLRLPKERFARVICVRVRARVLFNFERALFFFRFFFFDSFFLSFSRVGEIFCVCLSLPLLSLFFSFFFSLSPSLSSQNLLPFLKEYPKIHSRGAVRIPRIPQRDSHVLRASLLDICTSNAPPYFSPFFGVALLLRCELLGLSQ